MRNVYSNPSSAGTSGSSARPDWIRQTRSATAFWTPTAVVLALTLVLVLCWPHKQRHASQAHGMPEAMASYVLLEGSYAAFSDGPFRIPPWPGPGGSRLPDREETPIRRLPSPEYTGWGVIRPWTPLQRNALSNALPNLADRPVADVLTGLAPAATNLAMTLSPGLQRCGFHVEFPPGVATNLPVDATFYVELDDKGDVIHLLAEPGDNPAGTRLLETAISRGHGACAGRGEVTVRWGR